MDSNNDQNYLEELYNQIEVERVYPLIIYKNSKDNNRLTEGKISTFHKGFKFQKGTADYPTNFALFTKSWLLNDRKYDPYGTWKNHEKFLVLSGVIMDNENLDYRLSLQGRDKDKVQLGYNSSGDLVHLILISPSKCLVTVEDTDTNRKYVLINEDKKTWLEHYVVKGEPFGQFKSQFNIQLSPKEINMLVDYDNKIYKSQQVNVKLVSEFQGWYTYSSDQDWSRFANKFNDDSDESDQQLNFQLI